jgi:hypothetical protein
VYLCIINNAKIKSAMTTVTTQANFKIQFNGSTTYFVVDKNGDCWGRTDTERKAKNILRKILKDSGIEPKF